MKCSFSGKEIKKGTGITVVKKDGGIAHFKNKKNEKAELLFNRSRRKTKWTARYHQIKGSKKTG